MIDASEQSTATGLLDRPQTAPSAQPVAGSGFGQGGVPVRRFGAPRRGAKAPRALLLLGRLLPHLFVLAVAVAVVAGGGFWDPARRIGVNQLEAGTPPDFNVPRWQPGTAPALPEAAVSTGYFTRPPLPATAFRLQITLYETKQGETIAQVAERFGRKPSTLLWANNMQDAAKPLPAGTKLRVPPIDGMLHQVQGNDTLAAIATKYKVDVSAITDYKPNSVEGPADLVTNQWLIVPGGQMPTRERVELYAVRKGDSLWTIADRFGITPSTIVWANNLSNPDILTIGQTLVIPPVNGVLHTVSAGETVEGLAEKYGAKPEDIVAFAPNGLGASQAAPGQELMIPGGTPPAPPPPPVTVSAPAVPVAAEPPPAAPPASAPTTSRGGATGSFRWPAVGTITTYFGENWAFYGSGGHNGLDIANSLWSPLVAADSGVVTYAGWRGGLGNAVGIDHQNGFETWYGHAIQLVVTPGQWVEKGQLVAYMGSTGNSTGSHTHFIIVRNGVYVDPLAYLPR